MYKKQKIQKLKETENSWYIYQNERDNFCFQHDDMAYGDFKDLARKTPNKILHEKAIDIDKNPKCDGYYYLIGEV